MARGRLFQRRKDGRVEVRLNDYGREFIRSRFIALVDAQEGAEHPWRSSLDQPIDPSVDMDDPVSTFERQRAVASNAELAMITADESVLSEGEAWAWLASLQQILRASAVERGVIDYVSLDEASNEDLEEVHSLQQILFDLAEVLS